MCANFGARLPGQLLFVHKKAVWAVRQVPSSVKSEFGPFFQHIKIDFIRCVGGPVVIVVRAIEKEDHRDPVLRKIVVVAALIIVVRIVGRIVFVVER